MSIQEFARRMQKGELAMELGRLRELSRPALIHADDDGATTQGLWPQWTAQKKNG